MDVDAYVGEIRMFAFGMEPAGWLLCDGRELPQTGHTDLVAVLAGRFGRTASTFSLPDLNGRIAMHGSASVVGHKGGEERVALTMDTMPVHNHQVSIYSGHAVIVPPAGRALAGAASEAEYIFADSGLNNKLAEESVGTAGRNSPHENMQSYQTLAFYIAKTGLFPYIGEE